MDFELSHHVAVVTGASKGIGLAITRSFLVADVVTLLASPRSASINGAEFVVDGGFLKSL